MKNIFNSICSFTKKHCGICFQLIRRDINKYLSFLFLFSVACSQSLWAQEFPIQSKNYSSPSLYFNALRQYYSQIDPYLSRLYTSVFQYTSRDNIFSQEREVGGLADRIQASIYGASIGDSLGSLTEAQPIEKIRENFPEGISSFWSASSQIAPPGSPGHALFIAHSLNNSGGWKITDDTFFSKIVLSMALEAREKKWDVDTGMTELAIAFSKVKTSAVLGIGGSVVYGCNQLSRILKNSELLGGLWWKRGAFHWDIQARITNKQEGGSGGVMRAWPMGIVFYDDIDKAGEWGALQSYLTHADPTAIASSASMAVGIALALQGKAPVDIISGMGEYAKKWEAKAKSGSASTEVYDLILRAYLSRAERPEKFFSTLPTGGFTSKEALAAAVYIFAKDPNSVMEAIYVATHSAGPGRGTDSDTIAQLAAALVGAHSGAATLPKNWINSVEGKDELQQLAGRTIRMLSSRVDTDD